MTIGKSVGRVVGLYRYPVKSMAGEALSECEVTARGLLGDRGYALVDETMGLVGSAKNPRAWPDLLNYRATYLGQVRQDAELPPVALLDPDGRILTAEGLSVAFGRPVVLTSCPPAQPVLQYLSAADASHEKAEDYAMPAGAFFDLATVNILFSTTLARLKVAHPTGEFAASRFRPNLLIEPDAEGEADPEAALVGHILRIGDVRLRVDSRCSRCVMTTLAQPPLSRDPGILKTVARENGGFAGLNVSVEQGGIVRVGDAVTVA